MPELKFSVVITTYNRSQLVGRAIRSSLHQDWPGLEVIVVDDASTDGTSKLIPSSYPHVRYVRQEKNSGLQAVRNRGIREAANPWVMFLDDDDVLLPGAIPRVAKRLKALPDLERYPVVQFARSNGRIPAEFLVARLEDYLIGTLQGDFAVIIQRERFMKEGLAFPESVRLGEAMLLWRAADLYGIPTWQECVEELTDDASVRQCTAEFQLRRASDFAALQDYVLAQFGETLSLRFPDYYKKKRLAAATYRLISGDRSAARSHLHLALKRQFSVAAIGLWALTFLPQACARRAFQTYRRNVTGWAR
jgi:glycosyltransferase involved in cell wall biosynthesis